MRKTDAQQRRQIAAKIAHDRQHPVHVANGEERAYREAHSFMSFTKGLPHSEENGLVKDKWDPVRLRTAIDHGFSREFDLGVPLGDRNPPSTGPLRWHFHTSNDPVSGRIDLSSLDDGKQHRRWEAPTAGYVFDLEGPDCQAVTMPPAPPIKVQVEHDHDDDHNCKNPAHEVIANPELVAEMAEVYWLAWLRDVPFTAFDGKTLNDSTSGNPGKVAKAIEHLSKLKFYKDNTPHHPRRRFTKKDEKTPGKEDYELTRQNVFRGHTPGERKGPYLSQFLLMGNRHLRNPYVEEDGQLQYGSIRVDMRVRTAKCDHDYMTQWNEWLDVQNGANVVDAQLYEAHDRTTNNGGFRFIATPRDLATYVHFDALYEAYLNACLWLLNVKAPVDPHFHHLLGKTRHTEGFALFGGPQVLSLMTEVATRGLKAVRFQKFNSHVRLRPEALAGLLAVQAPIEDLRTEADALPSGTARDDKIAEADALADASWPDSDVAHHIELLYRELVQTLGGSTVIKEIRDRNKDQNRPRHDAYLNSQSGLAAVDNLPLLPMAFPEGSPMHPSYGAGHATVAGACVTILKAFFDEDACIGRDLDDNGTVKAVTPSDIAKGNFEPVAFVPESDGSAIDNKGAKFGFLRLGDELNKLAANISIARNMAGVHYYSDYIDSLRMGEEVAIGILQEQSIMYPKDPFNVSLTTFDGHCVVIGNGEVQVVEKPSAHHDSDHAESPAYHQPYQIPMAAS